MNEILLLLTIPFYFGIMLLFYKNFGKTGLYLWTAIGSILANIEVLILVHAFNMDMTLGNVLFSCTFLVTDILSEKYGKKEANIAVKIGIFTTIAFTLINQSWLLFIPAAGDFAMPSMQTIFGLAPRPAIVGVVVYFIVQKIDIVLYHKWWEYTSKTFGDGNKYLWLRNNGSTLISQLINTVLFTLFAFYGIFSNSELIPIMISSYVVFAIVAVIDTPFMYLACKMKCNDDI